MPEITDKQLSEMYEETRKYRIEIRELEIKIKLLESANNDLILDKEAIRMALAFFIENH